jgi:hypothetical protein
VLEYPQHINLMIIISRQTWEYKKKKKKKKKKQATIHYLNLVINWFLYINNDFIRTNKVNKQATIYSKENFKVEEELRKIKGRRWESKKKGNSI